MGWTNSLKRTRNGSIYSQTVLTLKKLNTHPNKRRKTTDLTSHWPSVECRLESLPGELLEQIFLTSMNGNLLTASPRIAVKLSGTQAVFRAAFLMAFYSHDIHNMFSLYDLHYLVPILDVRISSWDIRSMTWAVLNSRWCTWGQVKLWLEDNLRHAVRHLLAVAKPESSAGNILDFMDGKTDLGDLMMLCWWAKDEAGRSWHLETCMWDIRITRDSDITEDEWALDAEMEEDYAADAFNAEWSSDLIVQYQMRIFGILTIGQEKSCNYCYDDEAPFREVVDSLAGFNIEDIQPQPRSMDFWQLLGERAVRATRNSHWLRETLAIEHFFWPEDQPFKVSPLLFRAAALADIQLEDVLYEKRGSFLPVLGVLFDVDPSSLPRKDPALLLWAATARKRIFDFSENLALLREKVDEQKEERGGLLNNYDRNKYRAKKLEHKYCYEMDWKIVFYILTGSLVEQALPDVLAPDFTERLGWLGEKLNPSQKSLDKAEELSYPQCGSRDVDIFDEDDDYDIERHSELEHSMTDDELCKLFGKSEEQLVFEALAPLDRVQRAEAQHALTAADGYYNSADHDDYGVIFEIFEEAYEARSLRAIELDGSDDDGESEDDRSATGDEDDDPSPTFRCGRLLHEVPLVIHRNLVDLDLAILFPEDRHRIPSKDTELLDPIYGPPKWFHQVDKPYLEDMQ